MKKKIVIVNNGLAGGGIERASTSMANAFHRSGFEVYVIALYKSEHFFTIDEGIQFIEPSFICRSKTIKVLRMILYLRKEVKKINPDVILAFGEWTNSFVILSTGLLNIPVFLSDRMSPTLSLGKVQNFLKTILYRFADGVIAQTSYAKDIITSKTRNKNVVVIPNPVNPVNRENVLPDNIIVTVGRLSKEKGHATLIKAFALLSKDIEDWKLLIVGDGKEREELERMSKDLVIGNRVLFVGHQKNISHFLSRSKIFVLPSLSEGFPNALIEAMSVPLPCISSNCIAGPSDIIVDGENGILVKPNDEIALYQAMKELVTNEAYRKQLSKNAYNIRETLGFETIKNSYLDFILK